MAVRLPPDLYRLVKIESAETGDSMNTVVVRRVAAPDEEEAA